MKEGAHIEDDEPGRPAVVGSEAWALQRLVILQERTAQNTERGMERAAETISAGFAGMHTDMAAMRKDIRVGGAVLAVVVVVIVLAMGSLVYTSLHFSATRDGVQMQTHSEAR